MNENKLLDLLHDFKMAKKDLEENFLELTVIAHAIETTINGAKEESTESQGSVQNRLDAALNSQKLVSQLREQLNPTVAVVEPSEEVVNESNEVVEPTISLTEAFRSQLEAPSTEEAPALSLADQLRSQLDEQEETTESDEEDYDEEYEEEEEEIEEYEEQEVEDADEEVSLSPLAQTFRHQMNEAESASLPDINVDIDTPPIPATALRNLSDVLREQAEKPSLAEQLRNQINASVEEESVAESAEANTDNASSLSMAQMIEQLRHDIQNTTDTEDIKKEEELVVAAAASSDNDVAASLRQQLLVQELKKQLK